MADGRLEMNLAEATAKANEMVRISTEIENLLDDVSRKMQEINDENTGTYQGSKKPAELRAELDKFKGTFSKINEQIVKSSKDINAIAFTAENE